MPYLRSDLDAFEAHGVIRAQKKRGTRNETGEARLPAQIAAGFDPRFTLPAESCYKPSGFQLSAEPPAVNKVSALVPAWDGQDDAFSRLLSHVLHDAIDQQAFPAASVAVTHRGQLVALKAFGHFTFDAGSPSATPATLFDLASLTKPLPRPPWQ